MKRILRHVWDLRNVCKYFSLTLAWMESSKKEFNSTMYFLYEIELEEAIYQTCKENNPTFTRNSTKRPAETFSIQVNYIQNKIHIIALKDVLSCLFKTLVLPCCDALLSFLVSSYRNISSQKSENFYIYKEILDSKGFANSQRPIC